MSRGVFNTPRDLGQVTEIVPLVVRVKRPRNGGDPVIFADMAEGAEQQDGSFTSQVRESIEVDYNGLTAANKTVVNRFLKLVVREYADQEGYTITVP